MLGQIATITVIYSTELWKTLIFVAIFAVMLSDMRTVEIHTVNLVTGGKYSSI